MRRARVAFSWTNIWLPWTQHVVAQGLAKARRYQEIVKRILAQKNKQSSKQNWWSASRKLLEIGNWIEIVTSFEKYTTPPKKNYCNNRCFHWPCVLFNNQSTSQTLPYFFTETPYQTSATGDSTISHVVQGAICCGHTTLTGKGLPSKKLTYHWGKGKSSSKVPWDGDMWSFLAGTVIPRVVFLVFLLGQGGSCC